MTNYENLLPNDQGDDAAEGMAAFAESVSDALEVSTQMALAALLEVLSEGDITITEDGRVVKAEVERGKGGS